MKMDEALEGRQESRRAGEQEQEPLADCRNAGTRDADSMPLYFLDIFITYIHFKHSSVDHNIILYIYIIYFRTSYVVCIVDRKWLLTTQCAYHFSIATRPQVSIK